MKGIVCILAILLILSLTTFSVTAGPELRANLACFTNVLFLSQTEM